ncbi:cytochrome c nitrite reductase small subunit [Bacteroides propionicifaciens]|uniref:cytochrome c nitrite reductase small subunit n=1 Tax=Bacteroides propionicifaciens TaxID=392838 RepID=UPI000382022A|nr:cytochrome c nitrite reductase small subunit [Bacteroides propionicifaciens]
MKSLLRHIPTKFIAPLVILIGVIFGLGGYTIYMSRAYSYLSDDPSACINCHIMTPYYQSWEHSSHAQWATCNDCHVPQNNIFNKYFFKAKDGLYHAAIFTLNAEPQVIRPTNASYEVIMDNCIRCHTQLNQAFVNTGMISYADTKEGKGKACWDCHTEVPHTQISNLSSSPNAIVPLPSSPVPNWLKQSLKKKKQKQ